MVEYTLTQGINNQSNFKVQNECETHKTKKHRV